MHDLPETHDLGRMFQYHLGRSDVVSAYSSGDPGEGATQEVCAQRAFR